MGKQQPLQRLESLDVLRGFDLFCLVALEGIMHTLQYAVHTPWFDSFMWGFSHVRWEGFSTWDLVMPLFMFMAGVSMPFAFSKFKANPDKSAVYRRIGKRVLLLWIFGMMCQGNLLGFNPDKIYLYSNTLQAIAMGYLITAMLFLHCRTSVQIGVAAALLLISWAVMQFVTVNGYGGGNYTPDGNLAEWIDRVALGRFRDGAALANGEVIFFAEGYRYTWILSSLNFGVTVLTGLFAGQIIKSSRKQNQKVKLLFIAGIAMVAAGWLWGLQMPIIKKIWTSSMVLVSSGYCFLLMGAFYYRIDYKGHRKNITWLKVYGMNSITAYMLACIINFRCIGDSLFFGLKPHLGNYYLVLLALVNASVIYLILWLMYKRNLFLKV
jgi:predicted acyltransferase